MIITLAVRSKDLLQSHQEFSEQYIVDFHLWILRRIDLNFRYDYNEEMSDE